MERNGKSIEELAPFVSGQNSMKALLEGNPNEGLIYCGQVAGRIADIPGVDELIKRIMDEAVEVRERLDGLYFQK